MKFNRIFIMAGLLTGLLAGGCNNDDPAADAFDNIVYIQAAQKVSTFFVKNSLADNTQYIQAGMAKPIDTDVQLRFAAAPELVDLYNRTCYDTAEMLGADYFEIPVAEATIPAGSVRSNTIGVNFKSVNKLDREKVYVLPVTIASASQVKLLDSKRTIYYVFRGAALINTVADIEKNHLSINWANPDVCKNMSALTIEALVRARYFTRAGSDSEILSLVGEEGNFLIRFGDSNAPGQIQISTRAGGFPGKDPNKVLPLNEWVHIAVTYDSAKPSNRLQIYVNGKLQSEGDTSNGLSGSISLASNGFYIGKSYNDNRWWPGEVSECRIWNRALSSAEINAKNHFYSVDYPADGLVAYWKFDEGSGNLITDYSGNGNNAQANSLLKWSSVTLPAEE